MLTAAPHNELLALPPYLKRGDRLRGPILRRTAWAQSSEGIQGDESRSDSEPYSGRALWSLEHAHARHLVAYRCCGCGKRAGRWGKHAPANPASRTPIPEVTPAVSGITPAVAPDRISTILGSYVGQALAQRYAKNTSAGSIEAWPQVEQGCRLGNYERTSALCRAAALAVHGWGDIRTVPLDEVVEFCDADYLEEVLALCLTARNRVDHAADSAATGRISGRDTIGIPASDVARELRSTSVFAGYGPDGKYETWAGTAALCARGIYASASPVCEAGEVEKRGPDNPALVPYPEVASFCDVKLINGNTETCHAAYRFAQPRGDPAR
jgi:hypothetical protein